MGVDLASKPPRGTFAGPHLAPQNHCFSYANPYILARLMGVDLASKPPRGTFAGLHLASQNHGFSFAKPYILARLINLLLELTIQLINFLGTGPGIP